MASPRPRAETLWRSPAPAPVSPMADEAIWRRLKEAGFDEESVKRRDKAALIAYITKLESEIYNYQHHMGLLILERKEWMSKYEQVKESSDSAEVAYKRDKAAYQSAIAEAKKEEENLKRLLAIEKECVANIEKAMHDIRAENAERKLLSEKTMADAHSMMEMAKKNYDDAESKLHAAEALQAEASRSRESASRKLLDIEAREDELRRQIAAFKSDCEARENEINLQKQVLFESEKVFHEKDEKFLERQKLLHQQEDYIFNRRKELVLLEKKLDDAKAKLEEDCRALKEEKSKLDLDRNALKSMEEIVIQRESLLDKRERELLVLQEKIVNKEYDEIQRRSEEHQSALEQKNKSFEAEVQRRRLLLEDELKTKLAVLEDMELLVGKREIDLMERENAFQLRSASLAEKEDILMKKLKSVEDKELDLQKKHSIAEEKMLDLQKQTADIAKLKVELEEEKRCLGDEKKRILEERSKLELTASERTDLSVLETRLKEEIDSFRAQKKELEEEADKLKAEKEKFEVEWELIDEKRAELRKEAQRISEEREEVNKVLRNEQESIKVEKELLHVQIRNDMDLLSSEREEFIRKMELERSELFNKIQKEREDFLKDIKIQRREMEACIEKRSEEIENYLREKEEALEQERIKELQHISSQKEMVAKELQRVSSELKRLNKERIDIALDRERLEKEWSEIRSSIDILNMQRQKLQDQRESLRADREEIDKKIEHLKILEELHIESENRALSDTLPRHIKSSKIIPLTKCANVVTATKDAEVLDEEKASENGNCTPKLPFERTSDGTSPSVSATFLWVKKYASMLFSRSPGKHFDANGENDVQGEVRARIPHVLVGTEIMPNSNLPETQIPGNDERGAKSSLSKRKRLNNSLSPDHDDPQSEPSQKQQRTMQNTGYCAKATVSTCELSTQLPHSDGEGSARLLDRTPEYKDVSQENWGVDKELDAPAVSNSNPPEDFVEQILQTDVEIGASYLSEHVAHVNGYCMSCENVALDMQDKEEKVLLEDQEPVVKHTVSGPENSQPSYEDGRQKVGEDEDEEYEERMSRKENLVLTT